MLKKFTICAFSDCHGYIPSEIPECDILCIAGDISPLRIQCDPANMTDWIESIFIPQINKLACKKIFLVAGNHDFVFEHDGYVENILRLFETKCPKLTYLENEFSTYEDLVIYGSPNVIGPEGWAFYDEDLAGIRYTYKKIPLADIAIFHQPLWQNDNGTVLQNNFPRVNYGSMILDNIVYERKPELVLTGHVHSGNHNLVKINDRTKIANVSLKDENYNVKYPIFTTTIEKELLNYPIERKIL